MTHDATVGTANHPPILVGKPACKKRPSRKFAPHYMLDSPFDPVRGEQALWVAVITQAMMDALSKSRNPEAQYHRHEAIRWLSENSKDFVEVCLCAGLDPNDVRRKAKQALIAPRSWRAEAGSGSRYQERKAYRQKLKLKLRKTGKLNPPVCLTSETASGAIIIGPWSSAPHA